MALSYEESKKLLMQQAAKPMMMTATPMVPAEPMTLSLEYEPEMVAAYSGDEWVRDDSYRWFDDYVDDKISYIDENKNITVDPSQVNISQEVNSQFIPFEMMQKYDGIDLSTMAISIHYIRSNGTHGLSVPVNVEHNGTKIKFVWLIDDQATCVVGNLKFEIHADGFIYDSAKTKHTYRWKSKPTDKFNIVQSLCYDIPDCEGTVVENDDLITDIIASVTEKVATKIITSEISAEADRAEAARDKAETYASNAGSAATDVVNEIIADYSTTEQMENYVDEAIKAVDLSSQLENYATLDDVDMQLGKIHDRLDEEYFTKTETGEALKEYALKSEIPSVPTNVSEFKNDAGYLTEHQSLAGYATEDYVDNKIGDLADKEGNGRTVKQYVDDSIEAIDVSDQLGDLSDTDGNARTVKQYVDDSVKAIDVSDQLGDLGANEDGSTKTVVQYVSDQLGNLVDSENNKLTVEQYVKQEVEAIDVSDQLGDLGTNPDGSKKTVVKYVQDELSNFDLGDYVTVETYDEEVQDIKDDIIAINTILGGIDNTPHNYYVTTYNEPYIYEGVEYDGKDTFVLYKTDKEDNKESRSIVGTHVITGGSGTGSGNILKIEEPMTSSNIAFSVDEDVFIDFVFTATDSDGADLGRCTATWKLNDKNIITKEPISTGPHHVNLTKYFNIGSDQKLTLIVTDDIGTIKQKNWYVSIIDIRLESDFDDTEKYVAGSPVRFTYTPFGGIDKTIHFILDGDTDNEITQPSLKAAAGTKTSYLIPAQSHGTHLLEAYLTAEINGKTVPSNKIVKDIIWFDNTSTDPVISTIYQNFTAKQYETTKIEYTVYDPNTMNPTVIIAVDGEVVDRKQLDKATDYYSFKTDKIGEHIITITCGEATKQLKANIIKLDIDVSPVVEGLAFDFNPVGKSNNSADRLWSDGTVYMEVSPDFDWVNGGYQIDENGDQYFGVKAGTHATIYYNLFADDPKKNGKEFKVIFRTKNIRKRDTSFLTCMNEGIGLDMKVEYATVNNSGNTLKSHYCEDEIIEYEFNINKDTDMMIVMSYEDGTPSIPCEYKETSSFRQSTAQPITIGSEDCDVFIYRMKAYSNSLTDTDIKNNFIADARSAEEMVARYNRNKIYNEDGSLISTSANGDFSVDALMKAAPDLRYIFLEVPQFTNDKDNKIDGCTVYFRYPSGTRPQDNWTCTGVRHRGQGTSSNLYGYAGRNIDLCMDRDESLFTYTDEEGNTVESSTITLTDTSYPTDYLNIKVNIASSENANNAQLARRFNEYQPFLRYARKKDSRIKDTMEFYNCVVFIRETSTDSSVSHREFNDTNWHFYAIGNVGDSKKTDDTRVNNKRDPKEHVIEITDADKPLSAFPTGKEGHAVCPIDEWKSGNTAYDVLYSNEYVYDEEGAFESFGGKTYEFRYEMKNITEEQRQVNIDTWRDLYTFVVTSTDDEFYSNLKNYFVVDSALYFYLFTERYTMVDNRAKNSFWHYGKVYISNEEAAALGETEASYYIIDDDAAAINNGYRYDLTFGYDMDTALGIDNTGDFVFSYGKEDTDYYVDGDPASDYVFRVADSVFFCRLRDLFPSEMQSMFKNREEKNAWESNSLISQWDNAQAQFPEELWRLDYERKYYRTYLGLSIDNSIAKGVDKTFLIGKFFGRKKYARRAFEINQEMYFATKYFGNKALSDVFWIRGNVPIGSNIKPNYSLTLVPYSDMYVCVQYTSTGTPIHKKVKAGETVYFENNAERMDFVYVYAASFIQEVGDLSRCYVGDNNFSSAIRLQKLVIGSTDDGYENTFMKEVLVANNPLLEYLDIRNISGINSVVDVTSCSNLKELYAEGTSATGAIFANGGLLETAHLPNTITSLSMKNLNYIKDFVVDGGYDNLQALTVENCPTVNTYQIVTSSPKLNRARLIGVDWNKDYQIADTAVLNKLLLIYGLDDSMHESDAPPAVLTGKMHTTTMYEQELYKYQNAWSDLEMTWDNFVYQYIVTFVNADENGTVLDTQYVIQNHMPEDPIKRENNPIQTPTLPSTQSTRYEFIGWDTVLTNPVSKNMTVTATYNEFPMEYTIRYVSNGIDCQDPVVAPYGSVVLYSGETPTNTTGETDNSNTYRLFKGWKDFGYVDGDKTIEADYDTCVCVGDYFADKDFSTLRPVEIYAMIKMHEKGLINMTNYVDPNDSKMISLGHDFNYNGLDKEDIIETSQIFTGKDSVYDSNIKLLSEDRDFVLAIDCKINSNNASNAVLAQCYSSIDSSGFMLRYNDGLQITWGSDTYRLSDADTREMIVLRHIKGDNNLYVYYSNAKSNLPGYKILEGIHPMIYDGSLVFGYGKNGTVDTYANGVVYWSKLWNVDLGNDACAQIACWPHEDISFRVCYEKIEENQPEQLKCYYLSDQTAGSTSSMAFIASTTLSFPMPIDPAGLNKGGWASYDLNEYLNKKIYNAFPDMWKQLIKQVKVYSSNGDKSTITSSSDCYIFIPSICELDNSFNREPYSKEGTIINHFSGNASRICRTSDGTAVSYWTRSPNVSYDYGVYSISETGSVYAYNYPYNYHHVRIMFSL